MALHRKVDASGEPDVDINPIYVQEAGHEVPRHTMPRRGMLPATALQVVRDELILDGNPRLNLATFVTTWMEPQAEVLMAECLGKNMIDKDEYPQTAELESRCVSILADLWHAQGGSEATGCSTTGAPILGPGRAVPPAAGTARHRSGTAPGRPAGPRA
jgi:glutamate decarboxylase